MIRKKILILGASGTLGSVLTPHLKEQGVLEVITHSRSQETTDFQIDLCDAPQAHQFLDSIRPDFIINLCALTNVDECEKEARLAYHLNTLIPRSLSEWQQKNHSSCIIHISTDQLYHHPGLNKENNECLINYYAYTKFLGERALSPKNSIILRTNFFGKSHTGSKKSFSDWLLESFEKKQELTLFHDVYFSPLNMNTLSEVFSLLIKSPIPGVYNLGSREGLSKREFALQLAKEFGHQIHEKSISVDELKLTAKRPKNMMMDSTHFEKTFNYILPSLKQEIRTLRSQYA